MMLSFTKLDFRMESLSLSLFLSFSDESQQDIVPL